MQWAQQITKFAYNRGYEACLDGKSLRDNPWKGKPGLCRKYWRLGWRHADMEWLERKSCTQ